MLVLCKMSIDNYFELYYNIKKELIIGSVVMRGIDEFDMKETREKKRKAYLCRGLAIFLIALASGLVIMGYIVSFRGSDGELHDGLGRILDDVPDALSLILPQWAGHIWLIIDCVALLGMVIFIDRLFVKSKIYLTGIKNVDF